MQGILVAGTGPNAGEGVVGDAIDSATVMAVGATGDAPPLIAARHAGDELRPPALVEEARAAAGPVVIVTSGGLLAPLAERYTNRDLASELKLPVVIAAPAGPGLLNSVMLALEAARGAGLVVPAVVLTGWPDQPGRVLLDERALLERLAATDVVTPADRASWRVDHWLAAEPGAPPPADGAPPPARVTLEPYEAWDEHPTGDPRETNRTEIMRTILEIAAAEGPMRASRAYALYNRASGGKKLTSVARAPLSSAVYWLAQERRIVLTRRDEIPGQDDDLIRLPDTAPVRVRELGPRTLEEVPLDEIAELATRLRSARGIEGATEMKRGILTAYGLVRLTARADEYLGLALDLAGD